MADNNIIQFPTQLTSQPREASLPVRETRDAAADEQLLGSLAGLFRAAGCAGLAEAFVIEAGGRCG